MESMRDGVRGEALLPCRRRFVDSSQTPAIPAPSQGGHQCKARLQWESAPSTTAAISIPPRPPSKMSSPPSSPPSSSPLRFKFVSIAGKGSAVVTPILAWPSSDASSPSSTLEQLTPLHFSETRNAISPGSLPALDIKASQEVLLTPIELVSFGYAAGSPPRSCVRVVNCSHFATQVLRRGALRSIVSAAANSNLSHIAVDKEALHHSEGCGDHEGRHDGDTNKDDAIAAGDKNTARQNSNVNPTPSACVARAGSASWTNMPQIEDICSFLVHELQTLVVALSPAVRHFSPSGSPPLSPNQARVAEKFRSFCTSAY
uniref:Uncharacterized protein n=1 Tax=Chrysotila carterae TaxID=13221 RepID=A0A7S4F5I6_CHRCT|mmetsp:Transcript_27415/g.57717  ORF Transcript_27415/g.57717 Transcript_27415/m.57717 type:complete len:316 (-) Transcript_27415:578-1525(-)